MHKIPALILHPAHGGFGYALLLERFLPIQRDNHIFSLPGFLVKHSLQGVFPCLWQLRPCLLCLLCGFFCPPFLLLQLFTSGKFRISFPLKQIPGILRKRFLRKGFIFRFFLRAAFIPVFFLHPLFMVFPLFLRLPVSVPPVVIFRIWLFFLFILRLVKILLPGKSTAFLYKIRFFFLPRLRFGLLDFLSRSVPVHLLFCLNL